MKCKVYIWIVSPSHDFMSSCDMTDGGLKCFVTSLHPDVMTLTGENINYVKIVEKLKEKDCPIVMGLSLDGRIEYFKEGVKVLSDGKNIALVSDILINYKS